MNHYSIKKQDKLKRLTPAQWGERLAQISNPLHRLYVYNIVWWDYISRIEPYQKPDHLIGQACNQEQLMEYLMMMGYSKRRALLRSEPPKNPNDYPKYRLTVVSKFDNFVL